MIDTVQVKMFGCGNFLLNLRFTKTAKWIEYIVSTGKDSIIAKLTTRAWFAKHKSQNLPFSQLIGFFFLKQHKTPFFTLTNIYFF